MLATYVNSTQFTVSGDLTAEFTAGRRIKADCGVDGYKYSTVSSSSYSNPNTTVTIDEAELTSNLTDVLYGIINIGSQGSMPEHTHDGTEGHGGQIDFTDLTNNNLNFLYLDDTPSSYISDKFLKTTTSGLTYSEVPVVSGIDGTTWTSASGSPSQAVGDTGDYYLDESTFDVYCKDSPTYGVTDLFTGGTPSVSSEFVGSYPASRVVDDNTSTDWFAASSTNEWFKYDFGAGNEHSISKLSVYPRADGSNRNFKDYEIHGSNNDSTWDLLHSGTIPNGGAAWEDIEFSNSTLYRYIRITILNTYNNYCGIREAEAFDVSAFGWRLIGNIKGADGQDAAASSTFIELTDTPSTYSGTIGYSAVSTGSGLDFTKIPIWLRDSGTPSSALGDLGDYYVDSDNNGVYYKQSGFDASEFNPADIASNITLSDNNTTATSSSSGWRAARSLDGKSTGKHYVEFTVFNTVTHMILGIGTSSETLTYPGDTTAGYGYYSSDGSIFHNTGSAYGDTWGHGDIIGMALDMDNGEVYFSKNGTWQNSGDPVSRTNPAATGLADTYYVMAGFYESGTYVEVNFGQSLFNYTVPTGYNPGFGTPGADVWASSGSLAGATTFTELNDTPTTYSGIEGNYLRVTSSGIDAIDGIILTASDSSEWVLKVTTSGTLYTEAV